MITKDSTSIIVRTRKEGIHCYPAAPEEVDFLKNPHRHIFHIQLEIQVFHDDRELEFILVKRALDRWLEDSYDFNFKSCEMIAKSIISYVRSTYPGNRFVVCEVFEDGENGARVVSEVVQ